MTEYYLSKEEKDYQNKIMRDFEMSILACAVAKSTMKKSYKEIFNQLTEDRDLIVWMQDNYYDLKPTEIRSFFNYSKNELPLAHSFIKTLYGIDTSKRINGMFIKTARKFKAWYDENKLQKAS